MNKNNPGDTVVGVRSDGTAIFANDQDVGILLPASTQPTGDALFDKLNTEVRQWAKGHGLVTEDAGPAQQPKQDRRVGPRPKEFTRGGVRYRHWDNVLNGSTVHKLVLSISCDPFPILANCPTDIDAPGFPAGQNNASSVYCPTDDWEDFNSFVDDAENLMGDALTRS